MSIILHRYFRLTPWVAAFALLLAADVLAQASAPRIAVVAAPFSDDMRLWSFGDCDRRFPYVETDEHKRCVRIVGSAEARDERALHVCEISHATDHVAIARCKATSQANKEKAAREGVAVKESEAPSSEMMHEVKALSAGALEDAPAVARVVPTAAVARQLAAPAVNLPAESVFSMSAVDVVLLAIGALALGAGMMRRKLAQSA